MKQSRVARSKSLFALTPAFMVALLCSPAVAGVGAAQKCEGGKNDASGKYAACMAKAERGLVYTSDLLKYDSAQLKCANKYAGTWAKLEGGASCPTTGDETSIQEFVDDCVASVAGALSGGVLPPPAPLLETGQTACADQFGTTVSCSGTGQDGDLLGGVARSFTDNGDGTISDNASGLMWEKLCDDGGSHDQDLTLGWASAFTRIANLNAGVFAGYGDWRVPNRTELESLVDLGADAPAAFPEFDDGCTPGCAIADCSCTRSGEYWSSSTVNSTPNYAWTVNFNEGTTGQQSKFIASRYIRAVRTISEP